jgi:WD40 repeat protein
MADLFISYKRSERAEVEGLAQALRELGLSVWFDASLSAGDAFSDEIDREARAAKCVLVCWSPSARESRWVKAEAEVGFTRDRLVAAYVAGPDGFEAPIPFNRVHAEDIRAWLKAPTATHTAWRSLLRSIGRFCERRDVEEFGALDAQASTTHLRAWLDRHQKSQLLVVVHEMLEARGAQEAEREAMEAAIRERRQREEHERRTKAAAEAARFQREATEARTRTERPAAEAQRQTERERRRAGRTRRTLIMAGGAIGAGAIGSGALWYGLYDMRRPFLRDAFPGIHVTAAGRDKGLRIQLSEGGWKSAPRISSAVFSPDGQRIAASSYENAAWVWDIGAGSQLMQIHQPDSIVQEVAFSPDGKRIAIAAGEKASVWDVSTGNELARMEGHASLIAGLAFSPDGARIITTSQDWSDDARDNTARVWDATTGREIARMRGHNEAIESVQFAGDGRRVLTTSDDRTTRIWDADTGAELLRVGRCRTCSSPDGAAAGGTIVGLGEYTGFAAFSPDGQRFATVGSFYDQTDGRSDSLCVRDSMTGAEVTRAVGSRNFGRVAFSPSGEQIACGLGGIWDSGTGQQVATMMGHGDTVQTISFSPEGERILTASDDATVRLWDAHNGAELARLRGHADQNSTPAASLSPTGGHIVSTCVTVRVWSLAFA